MDTDNFNNDTEQKMNEDIYAKLLGVEPPEPVQERTFLGTCPACGDDVFADKPHVENTVVMAFGDNTGNTGNEYFHMTCWKFGGR